MRPSQKLNKNEQNDLRTFFKWKGEETEGGGEKRRKKEERRVVSADEKKRAVG